MMKILVKLPVSVLKMPHNMIRYGEEEAINKLDGCIVRNGMSTI